MLKPVTYESVVDVPPVVNPLIGIVVPELLIKLSTPLEYVPPVIAFNINGCVVAVYAVNPLVSNLLLIID